MSTESNSPDNPNSASDVAPPQAQVVDITKMTGVTTPVVQPGDEKYDMLADLGASLQADPSGDVIRNRRIGGASVLGGTLALAAIAGPGVAQTVGNAAESVGSGIVQAVDPASRPQTISTESPKVTVTKEGKITVSQSVEAAVALDRAASAAKPAAAASANPETEPTTMPESPAYAEATHDQMTVQPGDTAYDLLQENSSDAYSRANETARREMEEAVTSQFPDGVHELPVGAEASVPNLDGPKPQG